jgi:hypothetical protein
MNPPRPLSYRTSLALVSLSIAAAVALGGTACRSGPSRGPGGGPQAIHIPAMEAAGQFFDNQISADVRFGRAQFPGTPRGGGRGDDGEKRSGDGRGPKGGGGGFSAGMGPMSVGGGGRGDGGRGPGGEGPDAGDGPSGHSPVGARARTEQNPAVQLHLTLTNRSAQPIEIEVLEFNSLLGNFAVHPAKVSIAPSGTATFDPMTSRLGIPQGDLPLKVRLRAAGKTEEQTLTLKITSETK